MPGKIPVDAWMSTLRDMKLSLDSARLFALWRADYPALEVEMMERLACVASHANTLSASIRTHLKKGH